MHVSKFWGLVAVSSVLATGMFVAPAAASSTGRAGYTAFFAATNGRLTANQTVATVDCSGGSSSLILRSDVELSPTPVYSRIQYQCVSGVAQVVAIVDIGTRSKETDVSPGDSIRTVIATATGSDAGDVSVSLEDLSQPSVDLKIQSPNSVVPTAIDVTLSGPFVTIPTFDRIRYSNITFNGSPLSSSPSLNKLLMTDSKGKPMVTTTGLTKNGEGFGLYFLRNN
jgi:hypothetical protein